MLAQQRSEAANVLRHEHHWPALHNQRLVSLATPVRTSNTSTHVPTGWPVRLAIEPPLVSVPSHTIPQEHRLVLNIDGQKLTYDARHVPDPPVRHFSKSIDALFQHWTKSAILSIDGNGIPLKYWPDVYKGLGRLGLKCRAWELVKVEWCNWKVSCCESRVPLSTDEALYSTLSRPKTRSSLLTRSGMPFKTRTARI